MASSIEEILADERTRVTLERTLQVTNNFSKFVDNSEVPPCAAILLSAIDFSSVPFGTTGLVITFHTPEMSCLW